MTKFIPTLGFLALATVPSSAVTIWTVGAADNAQPFTAANPGPGGGGVNARFVQEGGGQTPLPGNPASPNGDGQSDDDYYLAGLYNTQVDGGAVYAPVGIVANNENNTERAFLHNSATGSGGDRNLRFHFNFPANVNATDRISVTFGGSAAENAGLMAGWNVEVSVNGVVFLNQAVAANQQLGDWTTPTFTLAQINSMAGAGPDNYVQLRGTSNNFNDPGVNAGGSRWLSLDYVQMDVNPIPEPTSFGFLALAAGGLLLVRRRRK